MLKFSNENPCNFHYVPGDTDLSFDEDFWFRKVIPIKNRNVEMLHLKQNDPTSVLYNIPIKYTQEELQKNRVLYEWYNTTDFNEDGTPNEIPLDILEARVRSETRLHAPIVFQEIQKVLTKGVNRFGVSHVGRYTNYTAYPHFHPYIKNRAGVNIRDCHTVVVVVPLQQPDPVTEKVVFNHQEIVNDKEEFIIGLCRETASPYEVVRDNTLEVLMPTLGNYLVLEFVGSRCLHWLENFGNKNEYLCLISEN